MFVRFNDSFILDILFITKKERKVGRIENKIYTKKATKNS